MMIMISKECSSNRILMNIRSIRGMRGDEGEGK